ncbi:hypothetical protein OAD70_02630 [Candidatus Pelagibacter sp.]|nr:hypothetical protein [Candidatus Pelagibacter sp.]
MKIVIEKKFYTYNKFFGLLLSLLLLYCFDYSLGWGMNLMFPNIYFFTYGIGDQGFNSILWQENGIVETFQVIILVVTLGILIKLFFKRKNFLSKLIKIFLFLKIIGITYIFFEELSWGQHLIKFDSPKILLNEESLFYNEQKEFNLHNMSNLFNEVPRALILIWCSLSIIIMKFFNYPKSNDLRLIVEPNKNLLILSYVILVFTIPDLILNKFDLIDSSKLFIFNNNGFERYDLFQLFISVASFNFIRFSELQEFFFYYYFFWHSIFLKNALEIKIS